MFQSSALFASGGGGGIGGGMADFHPFGQKPPTELKKKEKEDDPHKPKEHQIVWCPNLAIWLYMRKFLGEGSEGTVMVAEPMYTPEQIARKQTPLAPGVPYALKLLDLTIDKYVKETCENDVKHMTEMSRLNLAPFVHCVWENRQMDYTAWIAQCPHPKPNVFSTTHAHMFILMELCTDSMYHLADRQGEMFGLTNFGVLSISQFHGLMLLADQLAARDIAHGDFKTANVLYKENVKNGTLSFLATDYSFSGRISQCRSLAETGGRWNIAIDPPQNLPKIECPVRSGWAQRMLATDVYDRFECPERIVMYDRECAKWFNRFQLKSDLMFVTILVPDQLLSQAYAAHAKKQTLTLKGHGDCILVDEMDVKIPADVFAALCALYSGYADRVARKMSAKEIAEYTPYEQQLMGIMLSRMRQKGMIR